MFEMGKIPDVVFKIPNLWLGIGDKFLVSGADFNNAEDLEQIILEDKEMNFGFSSVTKITAAYFDLVPSLAHQYLFSIVLWGSAVQEQNFQKHT